MNVRISTTVPWPNPSEVFSLDIGGAHIPLILIAIMTMVLITSSGTMAMAVNFGYRRHRANTTALMLITAAFGATFVGMQAFEWTKLIREGVRPWGNPLGATQFGSCFFMITGFHGLHVSAGGGFFGTRALRGGGGFFCGKGGRELGAVRRAYLRVLSTVWGFVFPGVFFSVGQ